jgi:hypothetical protein
MDVLEEREVPTRCRDSNPGFCSRLLGCYTNKAIPAIFGARSQKYEKQIFASSCLSVRPH